MTKPTGRPRGRPPKKKPLAPQMGRGRPAVALQDDADRFAVAMVEALHVLNNGRASERTCALAVAAVVLGTERKGAELSNRFPGLVRTFWEKVACPGAPQSLEGFAATLRQKRRRAAADPAAAMWLMAISQAMVIALTVPGDLGKQAARARAEAVGEDAFARDVLTHVIDAPRAETT